MQKKPAGTSPPLNAREAVLRRRFVSLLRSRGAIAVAIFLLAFGVRLLTWHDTRLEVGKIQTSVVADYQRVANLIRQGGVRSFFSSSSPLADLNNLGHPPGYSVLLAAIYSIAGQSNAAVQMCQITADALSAVLLFLIVAELLTLSAGVLAALMAALSPQLAWNSVLLLPDSISVFPVLLAVYLLTRAVKNPRLLSFIVVGALLGVTCWLRANGMLLTVFVAAAVPLLVRTPKRWQLALAVICGTLLIVLPLTIRNAMVFHRFIPLSLGAGQTFLEGIADYDKDGRFGIPSTDMGIMQQEAEIYQRPDYYGTLFNPDGVERERARLSRGFVVIRSHPIWFAGVMAKRASSMVRLERARLLSRAPAITHSPDPHSDFAFTQSPYQILKGVNAQSVAVTEDMESGVRVLRLTTNDQRYGFQAAWPLPVKRNHDYLMETAIKAEGGRIRLAVVDSSGQVLNSAVIETVEGKTGADAFVPQSLPFVATDDNLQIVISNEGSVNNPVSISSNGVYELGASRLLWTRYPRLLIHTVQKIFMTAVVLPLAIIGLLMLILRRQTRALVILSVVPIYFFLVQSIVHTEYRYVIAVTYFLFAFAGVTVGWGVQLIVEQIGRLTRRSSLAKESVPSA